MQILCEIFEFKYQKLIQLLKNALRIKETELQVGVPPAGLPICNLRSRLKAPQPGRELVLELRAPKVQPCAGLSPLQPVDTGSPHRLSFPLPVDPGLISFPLCFRREGPKL